MKCPRCASTELAMSARQDVEIDYCPACRGVWLDRGELDKIIERANAAFDRRDDDDEDDGRRQHRRDDRYDDDDDDRFGDSGRRDGRRSRGFFGRFFDFD